MKSWTHVDTYPLAPFAFAKTADGFAIDARHLQALYAIAAEIHPRCMLEIGAYHGFSTAMLVCALNAGFCEEIHIIEPRVRDELRCVLAHARLPKHVHLHECTSAHAPLIQADFWLIDGEIYPKPAGKGKNLVASIRCRRYFTSPPSPAKSWLKITRWPRVARIPLVLS